jgi:hypothetical protein
MTIISIFQLFLIFRNIVDISQLVFKISDIPKLLASDLLLWRFDQDHRQKEKRCYSPSSSFFKQQRQRGRS